MRDCLWIDTKYRGDGGNPPPLLPSKKPEVPTPTKNATKSFEHTNKRVLGRRIGERREPKLEELTELLTEIKLERQKRERDLRQREEMEAAKPPGKPNFSKSQEPSPLPIEGYNYYTDIAIIADEKLGKRYFATINYNSYDELLEKFHDIYRTEFENATKETNEKKQEDHNKTLETLRILGAVFARMKKEEEEALTQPSSSSQGDARPLS